MRCKLGLLTEQDGDDALIDGILTAMYKTQCDFTNTFLILQDLNLINGKLLLSVDRRACDFFCVSDWWVCEHVTYTEVLHES